MKRPVALTVSTLWTASAAAAVGLGFLAVSLVDADTSPVTRPSAATGSVTAAPSASGSGSGSEDAAPPTPSSSLPVAAAASGEHATVGGTVLASCDGGLLQVAAAPAAGWWLDDSDQHGEVEFESHTQEVEVHVACADGVPTFVDEGVRADDDRPEDSGPSSSSASPVPASPAAGVDDSDGRVGGGHGSDDPPGDDSAGRGDDDGDEGDDDGRGRGRGGDDSRSGD